MTDARRLICLRLSGLVKYFWLTALMIATGCDKTSRHAGHGAASVPCQTGSIFPSSAHGFISNATLLSDFSTNSNTSALSQPDMTNATIISSHLSNSPQFVSGCDLMSPSPSAADFHLSQVFFNATGLQNKAFFINRPTASPDPDERATQEEFGEVLYIGRETFADQILQILK